MSRFVENPKIALSVHKAQNFVSGLLDVATRFSAGCFRIASRNRLNDCVMFITRLIPVIQIRQLHPDMDLAFFQQSVEHIGKHRVATELCNRSMDLYACLHLLQAPA